MDKKHASVLYFGNTEQFKFPLVLVFGREASTTQEIGNFKGRYDFLAEKNQFWDQAYTQIALAGGTTARLLKENCVAKKSSPILFAPSLPVGIDATVKDKWPVRAAVSAESSRAHIARIFAFESLLRRVQLIVVSGLEREEFAVSREAILAEAAKIRTATIAVPYFGESFRKPENGIFPLAEQKKIAEVVRTFALV